MTNVMWFDEIKKEDLPDVGGKGANLGEMYQHFPVPNGFCVTVKAYKEFITPIAPKIHEMIGKIDMEDTAQLEKTAKKVRDNILKKPFPEDLKQEIAGHYKGGKVAVRSSATAEDLLGASFAGQHDTFLNIKGEKELAQAIHKCWASLFTGRAIYYREKHGFKHEDVHISVVVQDMVDAKHAGVMFTVDPVNKKHILIEVVKGLGEKLVSGQVTPNTYFLNRENCEVEQENIEFEFDSARLPEIAEMGKNIERHFGNPQDIEFAIDKEGKILILQARPITTL
ncbi:MAG: hypothetical protein KJ709_05395 [Nanoarchaeota archaeon]|nr:hypothetical protein [Nanoarchaeota archaeon]